MLKNMKIKNKIIVSFSIIILLTMLLIFFVIFSLLIINNKIIEYKDFQHRMNLTREIKFNFNALSDKIVISSISKNKDLLNKDCKTYFNNTLSLLNSIIESHQHTKKTNMNNMSNENIPENKHPENSTNNSETNNSRIESHLKMFMEIKQEIENLYSIGLDLFNS